MAGSIELKAGTAIPTTISGTIATGVTQKVVTLDNTAGLADWSDFALQCGFSSAPTPGVGIVIALYAVPYADGTNAPSVNTTGPVMPSSSFVGNFEVILNQTAAQFLVAKPFTLSALKYDLYITNLTGQTIAASAVFTTSPTLHQYT